MAHVIENVACTVCGCLCDDLRITVEGERIQKAEGACHLSEPWFLQQGTCNPPAARIEGQSATSEALDKAAEILSNARSPLIFNLSQATTAGQRAAVALAEKIGATIDTFTPSGQIPWSVALQEAGLSTCTLGEVKNRADLVIFWGADPAATHPRHFERYSVEPRGLFLPHGRSDRFVFVADTQPTATSQNADAFLPISPGQDFEVLWSLRGLIRDIPLATNAALGAPLESLKLLAARMKSCRFGVVFFGPGLLQTGLAHRTAEALLRLVSDLNDFTRFYAIPMRGPDNLSATSNVLSWQTGYPCCVNFARGYPRYNPGEFSAQHMLERREVDACVVLGSSILKKCSPAALYHLGRVPTIFLDDPLALPSVTPTVHFTTSIPGIHFRATAERMDDVSIPLRALLPSSFPPAGKVLDQIKDRVRQSIAEVAPRQTRT